jgi:asparagine synthetase A
VTAETLKVQLEMAHQLDLMKLQYHQGIWTNRIPLATTKTPSI